jgi:hypothetical protein
MAKSRSARCTVCRHPQRPSIDLAIALKCSAHAIAARFRVSHDAVDRHRRSHLTAEVRAALATKVLQREGDMQRVLLEEGVGIVDALKAVRGPLFSLYLAAVDAADAKVAASLAGRLHESLSLSARVTGELAPHTSVSVTNIVLSQDYMRLRAELLRILARYPEARAEVAHVFRIAGEQAATEMHASERHRLIEARPNAAA